MKRALYLMSSGRLGRKQNTLVFEASDGTRKTGRRFFPVEQIQEIHAFGELELNKRLLEFLSQKEILLHFYNRSGYYLGSFYPREHYNSGYMVLKQAEHYLDPVKRLSLARRFVEGGIVNMIQVLRYYLRRGLESPLTPIYEAVKSHMERINSAVQIEQLMQVEGKARQLYYQSFNVILDNEDFRFGERTRRPPCNRLNALLSFGNSLLYTTVLSEIYKTHLDPRIGFLHATNFRRFSLNLDVAEVFKPILVDRLVLSLVQKGMVKARNFERKLGGVYLKEKGRKVFIEAWEERLSTTIYHRGLKRNVSYRRLIRMELYKIERHLIGEKEYEPFRSRW